MTVWWIFFGVFILAMLALDLGVFNRKTPKKIHQTVMTSDSSAYNKRMS